VKDLLAHLDNVGTSNNGVKTIKSKVKTCEATNRMSTMNLFAFSPL